MAEPETNAIGYDGSRSFLFTVIFQNHRPFYVKSWGEKRDGSLVADALVELDAELLVPQPVADGKPFYIYNGTLD